jgi:AcrR family transcriptional regulator
MPAHRSLPKSDRTRQRIMHAAEQLFAAKGFRAMTLREVTQAAGVNLAAVSYHFGSKRALIREVIRTHIEPINHIRLQRLDALAQSYAPAPIPLPAIFDALVRPLFEQAARSQLPQLIGRSLTEPAHFLRALHQEFFTELTQRFIHELQRSCPHLQESELRLRLFLSVSTMLGSIIETVRLENMLGGKFASGKSDTLVTELTAFIVAGFEHP